MVIKHPLIHKGINLQETTLLLDSPLLILQFILLCEYNLQLKNAMLSVLNF